MLYLKKSLSLLFVLFAMTGITLADSIVSNGNQLKTALDESSNPAIRISRSFDVLINLGELSNKNAEITFSTGVVTVSGVNQYKAFDFIDSTFVFKGGVQNSTSTFASFSSVVSSGAVISSTSSYVSISSMVFSSNTALAGGVLYSTSTEFDIVLGTFSYNTSLSSGGALFIEYSTGILKNVHAEENTAADFGGFMAADKSSFSIITSTFTNNSADYGGALSVSTSTFFLYDIYFESNTASSGGGIYVIEGGTFSVLSSTFAGNNASSGGAVFLQSSSSGIFKYVDVATNTAANGAGFYFDKSWNMGMEEISFYGNTASNSGGAFYVSASTDIRIKNMEFIGNSAAGNGGAAFAENSEINFNMIDAIGNNAGNGGAFYFKNSDIMVIRSSFDNNTAQTSGGAVYSDSSSVLFYDTNFIGNSASATGGAIYVVGGGDFVFESGRVDSNSAPSGGGVYVKNSNASFKNVSFLNNFAGQNGGAIFVDNSTVTINGGTFSGNRAALGGAAYIASNGELILNAASSEIKFTSNTAGSAANDIYLANNSKLTLNAQNYNISLNGGIAHAASPSNIVINKTGANNLNLGGNNVIGVDINILQGGVHLNESASLSMNKLDINSGNRFFAQRGSSVNITTLNVAAGGTLELDETTSFNANTLNMYGKLIVGVDIPAGVSDSISANTVNLSSTSSTLELGGNLSKGTGTFKIIDASLINGNFSQMSGAYGSRINWSMTKSSGDIDLYIESIGYDEITGLGYNQTEAAKVIDKNYESMFNANNGIWRNVVSPMDALGIDDIKSTLDELSGFFYADLLKIAAANNQKRNIFGQIRIKNGSDENSWAQASFSMLTLKKDDYLTDDFEDTVFGAQAGWDLINREGIIGGLTINYQNHDIKHSDDSATVNSIEGGAYGALFKGNFEFKSILSLGFQSYEVQRKIKLLNTKTAHGNFTGYSASLNAQTGYNIDISDALTVKPFVELGAATSINEKIEETGADFGLKIDSQNYFYSDALAGIGFEGYHGKVTWYINGGAGYALTDFQNEIETEFIQTDGKMKVKGSEQDGTLISARCGVEVAVHELFYVYANGGYGSCDGYENMSANVGVRYRLMK